MDQGIVAKIEGWADRPVRGGYDGLRRLADEEFTGVLSARGAWLFLLNGRIVGVADGSVSTFREADGTAYEAPHPSLPLLFAMQERGGETEARYYTDDTPLSEVDQTLTEGNFTGYIELSENVLSGDYFQVYYGGRSLSVAFIGNAEQLVTDDEAFDLATDEVGIYEVRSVDLDVQTVPEGDGSADETAPPAAADTATAPPDRSSDDGADRDGDDGPHERDVDTQAEEVGRPDPPIEEAEAADGAAPPRSDDGPREDDPPRPAEPNTGRPSPDPDPPRTEAGGTDAAARSEREHGRPDERPPAQPESGDPFSEEEAWRETRTIPSLDPEETKAGEPAGNGESDERVAVSGGAQLESTRDDEPPSPRIQELSEAVAAREARIEALEGELDDTSVERDRLAKEVETLERRLRDLEARLESEGGTATAGRAIEATEALTGTDIFIRYESKGQPTLEDAHRGDATREDVNANLRLEDHTRFDADAVTVDGRPYREFLTASLEFRFVRWLIEDLLYEIRDTNNRKGLRDLFDALPIIDRIAFDDTVTMRDDGGEELRQTFQIVCRDRMGQPLVVADLNPGRDPATSDMMGALIERSSSIAEAFDTVMAGFLVTASFFEPDALETAAEATGHGLLGRESRKSFVKLSRKRGFHLCLVEARDGAFHVAVPEL